MPRFGGPGRKKKKCLQRKCILTESHDSSIQVQGFTLTLNQHDLNTLNHPNWLNDQVMDIVQIIALITLTDFFPYI